MNQKEIKIFYSWQSDMPCETTKNIIQECIEATKKEMKGIASIEIHRDTKGEPGSPDIPETIFKKINECDIFIADVSIVGEYEQFDKEGKLKGSFKKTANPNVLIELGYAAHTIGWDNIIYIINTDYGKMNDLPFDIRNRRLTPYSLEQKGKNGSIAYLSGEIQKHVIRLQENGIRTKEGFSHHIIKPYGIEKQKREKFYKISKSNWFKDKRKELLKHCEKLIKEIDIRCFKGNIKFNLESVQKVHEARSMIINKINEKNFIEFKFPELILNIDTGDKRKINSERKEYIKNRIKSLFEIDLKDVFFELEKHNQKRNYNEISQEENNFFANRVLQIMELEQCLYKLDTLDSYVHFFENLLIFPLEIFNSSTITDENIHLLIKVSNDSLEIINPINERMLKDFSGEKYEIEILEEFITEVTKKESEKIKENYKTSIKEFKNFIQSGFVVSPKSNELKLQIAKLQANSTKLLPKFIIGRPNSEIVTFTYEIKSDNSNGHLAGKINYKIEE